jgi:hypothetical protein
MTEDVAHKLTPFGDPDGSRANLKELNNGFVSFGDAIAWGGLSTPESDLTARVLVGRKGSGKTLYLRRLQAYASDQRALYADSIQRDLPTTDDVVNFCEQFSRSEKEELTTLNERWIELWRRAILRSLASHILCNLKGNVSAETVEKLVRCSQEVARQFTEAVSVYSQLKEIVTSNRSRSTLQRYFGNPAWNDLEMVLARALSSCPPICFYIDSLDDEFENAPMHWLECHKGLFYTTMRLLQHGSFGSRLHVITCIRDIVLASVYRGEHASRYKGESHIRVLSWNRRSIEHFLREKLHMLHQYDPAFDLATNGNNNPIASWLGISEVENTRRGCRESSVTYLLRHTRLLPRDIITMGNLLSRRLAEFRETPNHGELQEMIRTTVSEAARVFGNEQLAICATEMVSSFMPPNAARQGFSSAYIGNESYASHITEDFKKLIVSIGTDRFGSKTLENGKKHAETLFSKKDVDPFSILWRNGLIGYVDGPPREERYIFYSDDRMEEFKMPVSDKKRTYVFHPILIDAVGIRSNGRTPVIPFN